MNKKILIIVLLLLIPISFSQEDPCITDPTSASCFEDSEIIPPVIRNIEEPISDEVPVDDVENEKRFFLSWMFWVILVLLIVIMAVFLFIYFRNKEGGSEDIVETEGGEYSSESSNYANEMSNTETNY